MNKTPANLEEFLKPTRYCDCDNEEISIMATQITFGSTTDGERAMVLFNYVKNIINMHSAIGSSKPRSF